MPKLRRQYTAVDTLGGRTYQTREIASDSLLKESYSRSTPESGVYFAHAIGSSRLFHRRKSLYLLSLREGGPERLGEEREGWWWQKPQYRPILKKRRIHVMEHICGGKVRKYTPLPMSEKDKQRQGLDDL